MNTQTSVTARSLVAMAERNPMGFTIDAQGNDVSGNYFVVGVKQTLNSHNLEGAEHCVEVMNDTLENGDVFGIIYEKESLGFGGWLDTETNTYHFDVVLFVNTLWIAKSIAESNNQLAIFDLETKQEIRL
jgi:hypothetical protein